MTQIKCQNFQITNSYSDLRFKPDFCLEVNSNEE
jgi:hypothetical protein